MGLDGNNYSDLGKENRHYFITLYSEGKLGGNISRSV